GAVQRDLLIVGRDRQRGGRDRLLPIDEADRVVGIRRPGGHDRVAANAAGGGGASEHQALDGRRGVVVDQPGVASREGGIGRAIDLALVVRRDLERHRGDGERARLVGGGVVGCGGVSAGDGVLACRTAAGGGGGARR